VDVLDSYCEIVKTDWTEDPSARYVEAIVHLRRYLHSLVRDGSPVVAARAGRMLLSHGPVPEDTRALLAARFVQEI
jgi:hypothetical protein